ncbi:MAG: glycine/betaine ABC transporter permease, partial [Bacillota bacterium]|nr:glycine/betaine ABC transporter permease [Bacillota bacterium]
PEIVRSLNRLQGKISAADMQEMNYQVNVKRKSAAKVAHQYLVTHHLLGGDR